MEVWKTIKDYNDYEISNIGIVRNVKSQIIKQQSKNEKGYLRVTFYKNKKNHNKYVHRLVAEAFIPNIDNKPTVNHIDGNKQNNCVDNLEWSTMKEQVKHAIERGLIKVGKESPCYNRKQSEETKHKMRIARQKTKYMFAKKINQYDLDGNYIKTWNSINDAIYFYKNKAIEFCCKGKRKQASGFQWKFYNGNTNNIGIYKGKYRNERK